MIMGSSPAAVSPVVDELDVFYLGAAYTLWTVKWTKAAGWTDPAQLPGVSNAASGPDATAEVAGARNMTLVYQARDRSLWTVRYDPAHGWRAPVPVNPTHRLPKPAANVDPAVGGTATGNPSYYYTATDGVIYHCGLDTATNTWTAWFAVPGGSITGSPDVSNLGTTHVDVVSGMNGGVVTQAYTAGSGWRTWAHLG
jgi:hypothetical protein